MKKIIAIILISLIIGAWVSSYSQPIDATTVTIAKPGIIKFDWTTGNLDYKGVNANADAADGDLDWLIYKYTWSSGNPTVIQKKMGSWTSRASYF